MHSRRAPCSNYSEHKYIISHCFYFLFVFVRLCFCCCMFQSFSAISCQFLSISVRICPLFLLSIHMPYLWRPWDGFMCAKDWVFKTILKMLFKSFWLKSFPFKNLLGQVYVCFCSFMYVSGFFCQSFVSVYQCISIFVL